MGSTISAGLSKPRLVNVISLLSGLLAVSAFDELLGSVPEREEGQRERSVW